MSKLLIIAQNWPEPNSSAAGMRMMQLIELFLEEGFEITFAATASENMYSYNLENLGIKKEKVEPNNSDFDEFLQREKPEIVLFDRFMIEEQFGWRVAEICPAALRILDTEDLHFLRKARQDSVGSELNDQENNLFSETAKREIASIFRCDLSLIISEVEMEILLKTFKISQELLFYLPFLFEKLKETTYDNFPNFTERCHFISIGNFLHPPNFDQTIFLKEEIWPRISSKLPDAELHIYGAYANEKINQLNRSNTRFLIKGRAENVNKVMQKARILLAPLRFGAGLKGKLFDAMKNGTPSVTTSIGAEGISGNLNWGGKIAETPDELADVAISLYQNQTEWLKAQRNGIEIINRRFQKTAFSEIFFKELQLLQSNLTTHRKNNFIGAILMHHSLQSTKYMSKWIETKNKYIP